MGLEAYEKSLDIKMQVAGLDHPDVCRTYGEMANIYSKEGKYKKALQLFHNPAKLIVSVMTANTRSWTVLYSTLQSSDVYGKQGKYDEGLELYHKHQWLDGGSKSLVRYDFGFYDLNLQNNLRMLRQLQYLQPFDIRH
jgi:pentatricopeptide repeat protein